MIQKLFSLFRSEPLTPMNATNAKTSAPTTPPSAKKIPHEITIHGQTRVDDYAWLKDENWQKVMLDPSVLDADIRAYL
jgi:oligopeptidase B